MGRGRPRLTDAELAAMPKAKRDATLAKRKQRSGGRTQIPRLALAPVTHLPAREPASPPANATCYLIAGIAQDDERASELYSGLQRRMEQAGVWGGEATHGILLSYVLATVTIERNGPHPQLITSQRQCWRDLKLADLPVEKVRKAGRYGGF